MIALLVHLNFTLPTPSFDFTSLPLVSTKLTHTQEFYIEPQQKIKSHDEGYLHQHPPTLPLPLPHPCLPLHHPLHHHHTSPLAATRYLYQPMLSPRDHSSGVCSSCGITGSNGICYVCFRGPRKNGSKWV